MGGRIYTRVGDGGETSLADGKRLLKDAPRVSAYGDVDELNGWVGLCRASGATGDLEAMLAFVQHRLFNCSSNLATPPGAGFEPTRITDEDVAALERAIDRFQGVAGDITTFVLPGGTQLAAMLHLARTVCRRAERSIVTLARAEAVDEHVLRFINRASDFFFAAARFANASAGDGDVAWDKDALPPTA